MAALLNVVFGATPSTDGVVVAVKPSACDKDCAVKVAVKITPADANAGVMSIYASDKGGGGKRILLWFQFHHEKRE